MVSRMAGLHVEHRLQVRLEAALGVLQGRQGTPLASTADAAQNGRVGVETDLRALAHAPAPTALGVSTGCSGQGLRRFCAGRPGGLSGSRRSGPGCTRTEAAGASGELPGDGFEGRAGRRWSRKASMVCQSSLDGLPGRSRVAPSEGTTWRRCCAVGRVVPGPIGIHHRRGESR
jgi:hypothetical protein